MYGKSQKKIERLKTNAYKNTLKVYEMKRNFEKFN